MTSVVLFSGGLDSTVVLTLCALHEERTVALAVDYGQPHRVELVHAARIARALHVPLAVVQAPAMVALAGPANVFPARNLVLLALAAAYAPSVGAGRIYVGANADDQVDYPDCRRPFFDAFERASGLVVSSPLVAMTKREVVAMGRGIGAPMADSWSCYGAGPSPCGSCNACKLRDAALEAPAPAEQNPNRPPEASTMSDATLRAPRLTPSPGPA